MDRAGAGRRGVYIFTDTGIEVLRIATTFRQTDPKHAAGAWTFQPSRIVICGAISVSWGAHARRHLSFDLKAFTVAERIEL